MSSPQNVRKTARLLLFLTVLYFISNSTEAQNIGVGTNSPNATLDVIRGTASDGTAKFRGTTYASHINYSTTEDTYIRAGKANGNVIINDIPGGLVGIGTNSPGFPLNFPNTLGDKISLWGNSGAHYGFGIQSSLLQIHSAGSGDDIAFGYGSSSSFTERMRIKGNGALSINGSTGEAGQVLKSNGSAGSPTWVSATNTLYNSIHQLTGSGISIIADDTWTAIPGLTYTFTATGNTKIIVMCNVSVYPGLCIGCGPTNAYIGVFVDGTLANYHIQDVPNHSLNTISNNFLRGVASGPHTIDIRAKKFGPNALFGVSTSNMILQIIPE